MSGSSALLFGAWLGMLCLCLDGCRTTTICSSAECRAGQVSDAGEGDGRSQTSATAGGADAQHEPGNSGLAGGGSAGEMSTAAGAGGETEPGVACGANLADCDDSRLTPCETNITWTARHCGGCGMACDGLCLGGKCEVAVQVMKGWPVSMVASSSTGFALIDELQKHSVLKIDGASAAATVYLDDVPSDLELSISSDRVYFFDRYADERLTSARLDGTDFIKEQVTSPTSVGATGKGAYYVSAAYDESTSEASSALMFRASGESSWKKLFEGPACRILGSSAYGLVVGRYEGDDEDAPPLLDLYVGETVTELGLAPANLEKVTVTEASVVALSRDDERYYLWWSSAGNSYEIEAPYNSGRQLIVDTDSVVMSFNEGGKGFIQRFNRVGPEVGRSGVANEANIVYVDRYYLWHGVWDDWVSARFLRSQRLDFEP